MSYGLGAKSIAELNRVHPLLVEAAAVVDQSELAALRNRGYGLIAAFTAIAVLLGAKLTAIASAIGKALE